MTENTLDAEQEAFLLKQEAQRQYTESVEQIRATYDAYSDESDKQIETFKVYMKQIEATSSKWEKYKQSTKDSEQAYAAWKEASANWYKLRKDAA